MTSQRLLEIRGLTVHFGVGGGIWMAAQKVVHAVDDVDLDIGVGEVVALVGESGSGKTTVARAVAGLVTPTAGTINLQDRRLWPVESTSTAVRREVQMIFQDPYSSLNPRRSIYHAISQALPNDEGKGERDARFRVAELLEKVGISPGYSYLDYRPRSFSGGQRQRIAIARALAANPKLLLADEAVSSLDVSIRAQILALLNDLQRELGLAMLFITHDLGVVVSLSDRVLVMYCGQVVETGPTRMLFNAPRHPYTIALLAATPSLERESRRPVRVVVQGDPPSPVDPPSGCRFRTRCSLAKDCCATDPPWIDLNLRHRARCHFAGDSMSLAQLSDSADRDVLALHSNSTSKLSDA